jgi:hypothetical protein
MKVDRDNDTMIDPAPDLASDSGSDLGLSEGIFVVERLLDSRLSSSGIDGFCNTIFTGRVPRALGHMGKLRQRFQGARTPLGGDKENQVIGPRANHYTALMFTHKEQADKGANTAQLQSWRQLRWKSRLLLPSCRPPSSPLILQQVLVQEFLSSGNDGISYLVSVQTVECEPSSFFE